MDEKSPINNDTISPFVLQIAKIMDNIRKDQKLSKGDWIKQAGISQRNHYKFEKGFQKTSFYTIESLAKPLNISMIEIFKKLNVSNFPNSIEEILTQSYFRELTSANVENICLDLITIEFNADIALKLTSKLLKEIEDFRKKTGTSEKNLLKENAVDMIKRQLESITLTVQKIQSIINDK